MAVTRFDPSYPKTRCCVQTANFTALSSVEPELLPRKFRIAGIGNFAPFCSCDLELDPMTFIYELDPYPLKISMQTENEVYTLRFSKVIMLGYIYVQTDATVHITTLLRAW